MAVSRVRPVGHWLDWPDTTYGVTTAAELNAFDTDIYNLRAAVANVKDRAYGAAGDGIANDYTALAAAAADAVATTAGTLYLPPGRYAFGQQLAIALSAGRSLHILGAGASTVLVPTFASGDAIAVTGAGRLSVSNLAIEPSVTRSQGSSVLSVTSATNGCTVSGVTVDATGGDGFKFDTVNYLTLGPNRVRLSGTSSGTALRIKACQGSPTVTGGRYETGAGVTGYTGCKPALHVTGTTTGLSFTGTKFVGAGPRSQWAVSAIASDAAKFTVTTSSAHDFRVGDFVVLRGNTSATYNSMWRVATVPDATSFTVTTTANPGAASVVGTAESVAACGYLSNEDSGSATSVNEGSFSGCLFEASQTGLYGSAALFFDGRRGTYPTGSQSGGLSGWTLTGNYYDQYHLGLLVSGMASNAANETTSNGFSETGGISNARGRAIHIDQAQAVTVNGFVGCVPGSVTPIDDGISVSAGLYVYAGPAAPFTRGLTVTGSIFGPGRNFQATNNTPYKNGILFDSASIDDVVVTGNTVFGSVNGIGEVNSPHSAVTLRWKVRDNLVGNGTYPPGATASLPSIASATTISLINNYSDIIRITGTTTITTVNVTWHGREFQAMFVGALTLGTGGNLAISGSKSVAAGDLRSFVFDSNSNTWYVT